jgi:hypothetical protein
MLSRVNNDVYELHAGDHEVNVKVGFVRVFAEKVHESLEAIGFLVDVLEIVKGPEDDAVAAVDETNGR